MSYPNKPSLIAAAIYALSPQASKPVPAQSGKPSAAPVLWTGLSAEEQKPFLALSGFLSDYAHGSSLITLDRAKAAASFEKLAADLKVEVNANEAVRLFVNIGALLS